MSTIKWSSTSAHLANNAPGSLIIGAPGSGKTFALLNFCANALGMGQRVIAIDPKNDFTKLYNVNKSINIVDINKIRPGALNPFEFLKKIDKNGKVTHIDTATLMTIIEIMCGKLSPDIIIDITPIVTDFVTKSKNSDDYVDMQDVADYLYSNPSKAAQTVGTMLKMFEDNKYGKLLFTRETNVNPLVLSDKDSMIISLHGLSLPDYNKKAEDYDANERFTSVILYILTNKLMEILSTDSKIPTTLVCDEAHLLFGNKEIEIYSAPGRSFPDNTKCLRPAIPEGKTYPGAELILTPPATPEPVNIDEVTVIRMQCLYKSHFPKDSKGAS